MKKDNAAMHSGKLETDLNHPLCSLPMYPMMHIYYYSRFLYSVMNPIAGPNNHI